MINTLFDKIFVLTINRNLKRRLIVDKNLKSIQFEYWFGFDLPSEFSNIKYVSDLSNEFFENNTLDKYSVKRMTKGQLGAYLSIKKIIEFIASNDFKQVMIFEDDFNPLKKNWENILCNAIQELPNDWDILLVGYIYSGFSYKLAYYRTFRPLLKIWSWIKKIITNKPQIILPNMFSNNLDTSGLCSGGHAFCLSHKGAILLSKHLNPMKMSGDELVCKLISEKKIKAYSVYPCLFSQNKLFESETRKS